MSTTTLAISPSSNCRTSVLHARFVYTLMSNLILMLQAPCETPVLSSVLSRPCPRYSLAERILLSRPCPREVPSLQKTEITKLAMREREMEERGDAEFMRNDDGDVIKYRYDLVTSHTARRSGITNLYLTGLFDTVQMMSISGHKDQRTFFDYIKLSSDEIADKIMEKLRQSENVGN